MLHRGEVVEGEATTINVVVELLANHRGVGRLVEVVATTAELVNMVILSR